MFVKLLVFLLSALILTVCPAQAQSFPNPPSHQSFISDQAEMITTEDKARIQAMNERLSSEQGLEMFIVTIDSLKAYDAKHMRIEDYAGALFTHLGIGEHSAKAQTDGDRTPNYGMLLLVSKLDYAVRLELGHSWEPSDATTAYHLMQAVIPSYFKDQKFSEGIREAAFGLSAMAGTNDRPKPSFLSSHELKLIYLFISMVFVLGVLFMARKTLQRADEGPLISAS